MNYGQQQTERMVQQVAEQAEGLILEQLNDLVSRGLLVVELGPLSFYSTSNLDGTHLKVHRTVKLVLKDKEYIETLEAENAKLKDVLARLKAVV